LTGGEKPPFAGYEVVAAIDVEVPDADDRVVART